MPNLTIEDIQSMISEKQAETNDLEYKSNQYADGKLTDDDKRKLTEEIVAFANTNDGLIIIGVREDDEHNPTKLIGVGFGDSKFENWLSSIRQYMLAKIRPHLYDVEFQCLPIGKENSAVVVSIKKSISRPHSFFNGQRDDFRMRYHNGIAFMDIEDLRNQFLFSNAIQNKVISFHKERLAMIMSNEIIGDIPKGAKLVFHIIPEWSIDMRNTIDILSIQNHHYVNRITGYGGGTRGRFNADGYCAVGRKLTTSGDGQVESYTQVFHNGIFEGVEIRLVSGTTDNDLNQGEHIREKEIYNWKYIERAVINAIYRYKLLLEEMNVPKPWHVFISLIDAKGSFYKGELRDSDVVDRDIVDSVDGYLEDGMVIDEVIKPVFDSINYAFGTRGSYSFNNEGRLDDDFLNPNERF